MKHNGEHTEEISLDKTGSLKSIELAPAELKKAQELSARIRPDDYTSVTEFGGDIQQEISEFAGHLLERVRSRDADSISASVTELMLKIKGVDVKKLSEPATGMAKVPWIGRWFDQVKKLKSQYEKLESQIDFIQSRLNEAYVELHKDTEMLDLLLQKNHSYFKSLEIHIAAVEMRLDELNQHEIPDMKQKAETTQNPLYAQKLNELVDFAGRLEKKLDDFQRTRFLSLSLAPRIKLLQQGNQVIAEKIQSITYNLIPLWKMELVTSLAQSRASRALQIQKEVRETIEESIRRNAEQMREVSAQISRESETGLVSMETLRTVHEQLMSTLEDTRQALEQGRKQRQDAEREMAEMEAELKRKVLEWTGRAPSSS